jgi:hypothetical protein
MKKQTARVEEEIDATCDFTGVTRSVECFNNQGFRNFRIITLYLERGRVVKQEFSDPYASFEAVARMEMTNERSILHLNDHWEAGKALCK